MGYRILDSFPTYSQEKWFRNCMRPDQINQENYPFAVKKQQLLHFKSILFHFAVNLNSLLNIDQSAKVTWLPANLLPPLSFCEQDLACIWKVMGKSLWKNENKELLVLHFFKFTIIFKTAFASYSQSTLLHAYSLHLNVQTFNILSNMTILIFYKDKEIMTGETSLV